MLRVNEAYPANPSEDAFSFPEAVIASRSGEVLYADNIARRQTEQANPSAHGASWRRRSSCHGTSTPFFGVGSQHRISERSFERIVVAVRRLRRRPTRCRHQGIWEAGGAAIAIA